MKMRFQRHGRQFFFFTFCVEGRKPVLSRIVKGRGLCPRAPGNPTVGAAGGPGGSGGFARMAGFRHPILDSALRWSACGDLTLIGSPFLFPVRLTRRLPVEAQEEAIAEAVERAESGMIPVCGFISPAEKELQQRLRASAHTRWIKMIPHGLPPRYDPSVEDSRAFAEGRLLVLSSFPPEIPVSPISRENCELMNARILKLCGPAAEPINTSHRPFREQSPFRGLGGKPPSFERLAMKHILPAITLSAALLAGCSKTASDTAHTLADVPLPVRTLSVTNAPFERAMTVQGTLEAVESATVSARIPGPLSEVCVDLGDKVVAGETKLFAVDSATVSNQVVIAREAAATARAHVAVAEANVAKAEAVAKKAVRDAERFARLHGEDRVSDNEWERAQTQRETAEADVAVAKASLQLARQQVSQAEAQLAIAERQLSDATLYAPCDGVVNARLREPGEQVGPGAPVIVVKGVKELKALAFLPAKHYAEVIPGETKVQVQTEASDGGLRPPSPPVETTVVAKSPAIDQRLRVFEIKALLPGSDAAVPGAMADFHVVFERREGVSVPQEAVLSRAAGTVVFVAQPDGTAKEVPVRVGLRDSGRAEILEGLALGDPVIVQGQSQLYDGRKIEVK